jgi:deazaflavin-dependent oxidoreductase (nitroreductase family)
MTARVDLKTNKLNAQPPHLPFYIRPINHIVRAFLRLGFPMGPVVLLRVRGRNTGKARRNPVGLFKDNGRRYLFSTFGAVNWVRNLRLAQQASIRHGWRTEKVIPVELPLEEAALVLKRAVAPAFQGLGGMMFRDHFSLKPDAPFNDFLGEARRHPVFELRKPAGN